MGNHTSTEHRIQADTSSDFNRDLGHKGEAMPDKIFFVETTQINVRVEAVVIKKAKELKLNVSAICREALLEAVKPYANDTHYY